MIFLGSITLPFFAFAAISTSPTTIGSGAEAGVIVSVSADSQVYLFNAAGVNVNGSYGQDCGDGANPNYIPRIPFGSYANPAPWNSTQNNTMPTGNAAGTYTLVAIACQEGYVGDSDCGTGKTAGTCAADPNFRYATTITITGAAPPATTTTSTSTSAVADQRDGYVITIALMAIFGLAAFGTAHFIGN